MASPEAPYAVTGVTSNAQWVAPAAAHCASWLTSPSGAPALAATYSMPPQKAPLKLWQTGRPKPAP